MSNLYSSPYYRSASPYTKDYYSPSVSDGRYSSPYRSDERDVYNASRGYDAYSRDHDSPVMSRNMSVTTNDLDRMLDQALRRAQVPPPPPPMHDPPMSSTRYRSPSPASRRYNDDVYSTVTSSNASRPYYRPRDDASAPIDSVGYGYRSTTPYRSMDGYRSRDPSPYHDRDDPSDALRRMSFERGGEIPYIPDHMHNYRRHIDDSRHIFDRERALDDGNRHYYMTRDAMRYDRDREYGEEWSSRYKRDNRMREEHSDPSRRVSYDSPYYSHKNSKMASLQKPYEDERTSGNRYASPPPPSPTTINDPMTIAYNSTPKEINIPMQHDYSTVNNNHVGGHVNGNTIRRQISLYSTNSNASILSTWHGDDVVLLPKGHQASEAAVAATAAASLIADDSSRICGFDTAADRISDFVKPGTGKDTLSSVLSPAVLGSPLQNHSHVPISYTNMQENMKRDLLVTATVNATKDKKLGSLPLDAYQFWSRCTLLVATAILKTGPNYTQLAHAAAETVMLHGIGTIHEDWKSTAEEDLKVVADAVHEIVSNSPGGNEDIASIASIALMAEGSKTLAIERIRESDLQQNKSNITREMQPHKNESVKPPIVRPRLSNHPRKNSEDNADGIESIRNTGSLLDNHSSNEEEDQQSADKDTPKNSSAISRASSGIHHVNTNGSINSRQLEEQALKKSKALEKKRGEIAERISRIQKRAAANHDMPSVLGHIETPVSPNNYGKHPNDPMINRTLHGPNYPSKRSTNARAGSQGILSAFLEKMSCSADPGDEFYEEANIRPQEKSSLFLTEDWENLESIAGDPPTSFVETGDATNSITHAMPYPLPREKTRSSFSKVLSTSMKGTDNTVSTPGDVPQIVEASDAFSNAVEKGLPPPGKLVKKLSLTPKKWDSIETSNDVSVSKTEDEALTNQPNVIKRSRFKMRFGKRPERPSRKASGN
jgi:hypothetical protein